MQPEKPQEFKDNDPAEDGHKMMQQAVTGLGIPAGTSMMNWPKKPLGKAAPKAGHPGRGPSHALERSKPHRTAKKGRAKRNYSREVGLGWGFD